MVMNASIVATTVIIATIIMVTMTKGHGNDECLYICYRYSDIEVGLCFKVLVTHLALGHVARARVILMQKITNS